jgi:UTP:GlnB (protein PII) uridylyltransferase
VCNDRNDVQKKDPSKRTKQRTLFLNAKMLRTTAVAWHKLKGVQWLSGSLSSLYSCSRSFSSNPGRYHVEVSNADRADATKLTVRGPDVPGLLASMTIALAVKGCSLVELNAANDFKGVDTSLVHEKLETTNQIKDIFFVINRETGMPFDDDDLNDLAKSVLESTKSPLNVVSVQGAIGEMNKLDANLKHPVSQEGQITIIPSKPNF